MIELKEYKYDVCIGYLIVIWMALNLYTINIIDIFINQQPFPPSTSTYHLSALFLPSTCTLLYGGMIIYLVTKKNINKWLSLMMIISVFILLRYLAKWKPNYIEYQIEETDLKLLCYMFIEKYLFFTQLLIVVIWFIMDFKKIRTYQYFSTQKLFCCYIFILISVLLIYIVVDVLYSANVLPRFYTLKI